MIRATREAVRQNHELKFKSERPGASRVLTQVKSDHTPHSKIQIHGRGAGEVSAPQIEQRARELALIAGRPQGVVLVEDRRSARLELTGADVEPTIEEDRESTRSLSRDPSDPLAEHGHQTPIRGEDSEQEGVERVVLEGVEEAQHEQMLADRLRSDEAENRREPRPE